MAYPAVSSVTATDFLVNATDHAANMPAAASAGDLLLAFVGVDGVPTITTPAGWTLLSSYPLGTNLTFALYAKVAAGTEGGTTVNWVTSATEQASIQVFRITGWYGAITNGLAACMSHLCSATGANRVGVSTPWGSGTHLWIIAQVQSINSTMGTMDADYGNQLTSGDFTTNTSVGLVTGYRELTASYEFFTPWDSGYTSWIGAIVAVRPA